MLKRPLLCGNDWGCSHTRLQTAPVVPQQVVFTRQLIILHLVTMVMRTRAVTRISVEIERTRNVRRRVLGGGLEEESMVQSVSVMRDVSPASPCSSCSGPVVPQLVLGLNQRLLSPDRTYSYTRRCGNAPNGSNQVSHNQNRT